MFTVHLIAYLTAFAATGYPQAIVPNPGSIAPVINPPNPQTNIVLSLANFTTGVTTYQAFKLALAACSQQKAAKLIIPTGTYIFDDPQILQDGQHIAMYNLSDLVIDGQGSTFIFHYPTQGIVINGSQRLLIQNLTIDTDLLLASLGIAKKETNGTTTIHILNSYPVAAGTPFLLIAPYDIANLKWKASCCEIYSPRNVSIVAPQVFVSPDFSSLQDGEQVIVQHYRYAGQAISVASYLVSDVSFANITIFGAPGMGFFVAGQRGFSLSNCTIMQKPGTQRPVSTAADGAHFTNTSGDILVENCDFSGQGDDSLNITGLWAQLKVILDRRNVILTSVQSPPDLIRLGDQLDFVKPDSLAEIVRANVTQVSYDSSTGQFGVTVDQDLPTNVAVGNLVTDLNHTNPRFLVKGNYFHNHRARGMLIQSRNGVVENNTVQDPTWQGIQLFTDAHYFFEGPGPQTVIVQNNTFKGCNYGNYGAGGGDTMGALNITADVPSGITGYPVDQNILVDGNTVSNTAGLAMFISSASGITISNNIVENSNTLGTFPPWYGSQIGVTPHGSIMVTKASKVLLTNNVQIVTYQQLEKGIYVDPQTTTGITLQGNSQTLPTGWTVAGLADFNGDGHPDYLLYNAGTRQTAIWYMNNNTLTSEADGPRVPAGWTMVGVADFNGDGKPDYLLYNASTRQTAIWYMNNNTFTTGLYGPTLAPGWSIAGVADFNHDGHPDYVLFNASTRQTAIWYLNNNVLLSGLYGPTLPIGWSIVGVADFNHDGHPDYVLFNASTRQTAIWYLNNNVLGSGLYGPALPIGWRIVGVADFNRDGHPDYLLYDAGTRQTVIWYLNNNVLLSGLYGPTLPGG